MRRAMLAGVAALLLGVCAAPAPVAALQAAPVIPQVTVTLDAVAPVDVNRDADANITVNGTVNVTVPQFYTGEVHVYFNVTVNNTYWPAAITPRTTTLVGSGVAPFNVTVIVPGRASVDAGAEVFVDANVSVPPGFGKSFTASTPIPIVQYFGVSLGAKTSASPDNFGAQAGKDTVFAFRLQNLGNGRDSFELRVDNLAELQAHGMSVALPSPISVPAKVTVNVNGNISIPSSLTSGNFSLSVTALSTGAASKGDTVTSTAAKTFTVTPPDAAGGGGGTNGTGSGGKGFLPGFDGTFAAVAFASSGAAAAWRRVRRP